MAHHIPRPHSTTPASHHQRNHYHHHHHHHHCYSYTTSTQHYQSSTDHMLLSSPPLLQNNKRLTIRCPSSTTSTPPLQTPHLTPPSPLIRPSRLMPTHLTRANSLPGKPHRPITPRSITARIPTSIALKRTHTSPPPPLSRLPTSPTPASAVTGASGLTVSGRMVEYESDHCRREALSKVLRAVSQSGTGRSRHHRHHTPNPGPSPSHTASSGGENDGASVVGSTTPSRWQEGFRPTLRSGACLSSPSTPSHLLPDRPSTNKEEQEEDDEQAFPFAYDRPPPGSQASGYISFSSLNLFAPPSPPESVTGFLADDEHEILLPSSERRPLRLRLPHPPPTSCPRPHLKT